MLAIQLGWGVFVPGNGGLGLTVVPLRQRGSIWKCVEGTEYWHGILRGPKKKTRTHAVTDLFSGRGNSGCPYFRIPSFFPNPKKIFKQPNPMEPNVSDQKESK